MKKQCPDCGGVGHTYEYKTRFRQSSPCGSMMTENYMSPINCFTCNGKGRIKVRGDWDNKGHRR